MSCKTLRRQWTSQKMEMLDARNGVEDEFELCRVQLTQLVQLTSDIPVSDMLLQVFGIDMYWPFFKISTCWRWILEPRMGQGMEPAFPSAWATEPGSIAEGKLLDREEWSRHRKPIQTYSIWCAFWSLGRHGGCCDLTMVSRKSDCNNTQRTHSSFA